ncbi:MAG: glutamate--tRNA ligase, partial [Candidatus Hydrogenedentota bacterium]
CFCSNEELEGKKKKREAMGLPPVYDGKCRNLSEEEIKAKLESGIPWTIRFRSEDKEIIVNDIVQGKVKFDSSLIGDFIIVKSDGFPSYNFAVVVDDHLMEISHVIRGVGHLSNTPRQILIYQAFDWEEPQWAHVSEIVGSDHKKLSKRHGATAITAFRDLGYPPEAFLNYMALLGWSPPDGQEFMSLNRIIEQFDVARCNKSPSMFDVFDLKKAEGITLNELSPRELEPYLYEKSKLNWLSNSHIRAKQEDDYIREILPFVKASKIVPESECKEDNDHLRSVLLSLRVYLDYYLQIERLLPDFYETDDSKFQPDSSAQEWLKKDFAKNLIEALKENLEKVDPWEEASLKEALKQAGKQAGVKGKDLFMTARAAITGKTAGLELPVFLKLLGKERVLNRLKTY